MNPFASALDVANAVLYEGYLLYPYTASSRKNRVRWQFGVVVPRAACVPGSGESSSMQTELLVEADADLRVDVRLRFLHVEARRVEAGEGPPFEPVDSLTVDGQTFVTFDEAAEREIDTHVTPAFEPQRLIPISFNASEEIELVRDAGGVVRGRIVRERWPLRGSLSITAEPLDRTLYKLRLRVQNRSRVVAGQTRDAVLRTAFVSTHVLFHAENGRLLSVLDPPRSAETETAGLDNQRLWPVLIGEATGDEHRAQLALAAPIILYDFPQVAAKTEGDAFDATEIDEILRLSVLSLSDAERDEARATSPRARTIIERAERLGREKLSELHAGDMRWLNRVEGASGLEAPFPPRDPLRGMRDPFGRMQSDPFADVDVPAIDCVFVDGHKVSKGSQVRLHPKRRADAWDTFLAGKIATVRAVHQDLEDNFYVAVTVDDDPASDLHEWYGRAFFYYPEEVEPLPRQSAVQ